jgi:hypothetical protein
LPAGTNNIGDVDIASGTLTTVSTVTNLSQLGGQAVSMGTGARDAGTQRVTIATDDVVPAAQSGIWNITNVSGTISLPTGAATAANQATANSSLSSIAGAVDGTEMQVDIVTSALPTGAATAALQTTGNAILTTIDADTGGILTSVELIDDAVFADDEAFTLTSSKVMVSGAIRDDSLSALAAAEGDAVPLRVNSTGALHVTGAGGGTQYQVDDAAGGTDTGTVLLVVRDDSLTTLTPADGDYVPLRVSSTGALHVTGGGGGTEYNEDDATPATITGTSTVMERDDALAGLTPAEGDWAAMRCSAEGALWVQDFNSDAILADTASMDANLGTIAGDTTSIDGKITACNTGAVVISSGTITTVSAVTAISTALPAGDNNIGNVDIVTVPAPLSVTGGGTEAAALRVTVASDSTGVITVDNAGTFAVQAACAGTAAHGDAVAGNPLLTATEARSSEGTAVDNGDVVRLMADLVGKLINQPYAPSDLHWQNDGSKTDTSDLALAAAAGAGVRNYITDIIIANSSSTDTTAILKDGSTEIGRFPVPANGGVVHRFGIPLRTTANTTLNIASAASVSTMYFTASGYTGR